MYATLDTQADTTFILEDTRQALGISGVSVELSLSTMHAENKPVNSHKIKGLTVRGVNSGLNISLPTTFSIEAIPANKSHIPTPDVARSWPHLNPIADKLMTLADCEVGLLIGYNCPRAMMPREVIPPENDGPYGQEPSWSIVGIINPACKADEK